MRSYKNVLRQWQELRWQLLRLWHWLHCPRFTRFHSHCHPALPINVASPSVLPASAPWFLGTFILLFLISMDIVIWNGAVADGEAETSREYYLSDCKPPLFYPRCLTMTSFSSCDTHWIVLLPDVLSSPLTFHGATQTKCLFLNIWINVGFWWDPILDHLLPL